MARALAMMALPLLASALRLPPAQFGFELHNFMQAQLVRVAQDAAPHSGKTMGLSKVENKSPIKVSWKVSHLEDGASFGTFISEACGANGKREGECSLPRSQKNPGMVVRTERALDTKTRMHLMLSSQLGAKTYKMFANCQMCGAKCSVQLPLGGTTTLEMPDCPMDKVFAMGVGQLDLSSIPASMHGNLKIEFNLLRGDGSKVGGLDMNMAI
uniref:Uncharacterized protein n=1 Tax=Alexandrium andersonii TaxID=327968 RepID=A0A7S2ADF3_9DINO|mmetsp:Transcript_101854/g.228658  ORF Transcript_101854/g.228658 Transcript_101854/m.228658 type:complete len:213 (+) Transcript_101854:68-706(+)